MTAISESDASRSAWRRIVADALRFDPSGVRPYEAARMAVGTAIPLMIGFAAGSWAGGAAAAGGALAVGITSVVPSARPRIATLASIAVGMALGTFIGSATSAHPALHVIAGAALAFACGLLAAVEPSLGGVGINTLVAFLVYGRFSAPPLLALRTAGLVAAGAALQFVVAVLFWRRPPAGRALTGLSAAYEALADFAADLRADRSSLPVARAIDAATVDLAYSFRSETAEGAWTSLANEAHRVRLELLSLATARSLSNKADDVGDQLHRLLSAIGDCSSVFLRCVADCLANARGSDDCDRALDDVERAITALTQHTTRFESRVFVPSADAGPFGEAGFAVRAAAAARALAGQLRAIDSLIDAAVSARRSRPAGAEVVRSARRVSAHGVQGVVALSERMAANLTPRSDAFRHAIRLAVVITAATALAHAVGLGRGYWLALTAVIVLRPEFSITFTRGVARAIGTLLGVVLATAIDVLAHPHGWVLVALVVISVFLCGALFNASYTVFSIAISGVVVFLLAGLDNHPVTTGEDRLLATVFGAALALIAYLAWPTWGRRPTSEALADLADGTHRYVIAVLRTYLSNGESSSADRAKLPALSRAARLARTNTESALERSLADPGPRQFDAQAALAMLAALRRLSIAGHTLRLRRPEGAVALPQREFARLVDSLDVELNAIAANLRFGRLTVRHEPLRDEYRAVVERSPTRPDDVAALLLAETDELVDATNTLNSVIDAVGQPSVVSG